MFKRKDTPEYSPLLLKLLDHMFSTIKMEEYIEFELCSTFQQKRVT